MKKMINLIKETVKAYEKAQTEKLVRQANGANFGFIC